MGFDSAFESAFTKGMSIGSTAVLQQIKDKKKKEEEANSIQAKAYEEQTKQNNKIELEKVKQGQDIAKTSMKSLIGMKEEIRKKQFEIMKDNKITANEKKVQFNELNKSYASLINGTYGQLAQVKQMTGDDYIGIANNAIQDLDLDEYVDVNISGKTATIKNKDAEIIQSNPNMYDIDSNNNVIDKTTKEVVTAHKSFNSIIDDNKDGYVPSTEEKNWMFWKRENPNATPKENEQFKKDLFQKMVEGVSGVKNSKSSKVLENNLGKLVDNFSDYLAEPNSADNKTVNKLIMIEQQNLSALDSTTKKQLSKDVESMASNHKTVNNIDKAFNIDRKTPVTKGIIDNTITFLNKITGNENEQAFENVKWDTRAGKILASFVKDMSGTAVSESERAFLTELLTGGKLADESYVIEKMKEFRASMVDENEIISSRSSSYIPASSVQYRKYEGIKGEDGNTNKKPNEKDRPKLDLNKYKM